MVFCRCGAISKKVINCHYNGDNDYIEDSPEEERKVYIDLTNYNFNIENQTYSRIEIGINTFSLRAIDEYNRFMDNIDKTQSVSIFIPQHHEESSSIFVMVSSIDCEYYNIRVTDENKKFEFTTTVSTFKEFMRRVRNCIMWMEEIYYNEETVEDDQTTNS